MTKKTSAQAALRFYGLIAALTASAALLPSDVLAAATPPLVGNSVSTPLIVQTRGNVRIASPMLSSMSKKAGVPLRITKNIGTGTYLMQPVKPTTVQGLHTIAGRLAAHPNVLGAQLYQQSVPAYMIAPVEHQVALNGARLSGSSTPIVSFRWHQITGPNTGLANSTQPNVTFLARQAASPAAVTSDPAAIPPGDLSAMPQAFDCAISAASVRATPITAPVLVTKNAFMCNPGSSSGTNGASPPDSGSPDSNTPSTSGSPSAGTPSDTGSPLGGTPSDTGLPTGGTPSDTGSPISSLPPGDSGTPSDIFSPPAGVPSGSSPGGNGLISCSGNCTQATLVPAGACSGNCSGAKFNGTANPGGTCSGDCTNASGGICSGECTNASGGNCSGDCSNISSNSVRNAISKNAAQTANIIGYRLIATDKSGIAHVRNIYVKVQTNAISKAKPAAKLPARQVKVTRPLASVRNMMNKLK